MGKQHPRNIQHGPPPYHVFCDTWKILEELQCPTNPLLIMAFVSSCAGSYSGSALTNCTTGLRAWHILHGQPWPFNKDQLRSTLTGAAKLAPASSKKPKREPFTINTLKHVLAKLDCSKPLCRCHDSRLHHHHLLLCLTNHRVQTENTEFFQPCWPHQALWHLLKNQPKWPQHHSFHTTKNQMLKWAQRNLLVQARWYLWPQRQPPKPPHSKHPTARWPPLHLQAHQRAQITHQENFPGLNKWGVCLPWPRPTQGPQPQNWGDTGIPPSRNSLQGGKIPWALEKPSFCPIPAPTHHHTGTLHPELSNPWTLHMLYYGPCETLTW